MQRHPDDGLPPRQLPSPAFPWEAVTTTVECEQRGSAQRKEREVKPNQNRTKLEEMAARWHHSIEFSRKEQSGMS